MAFESQEQRAGALVPERAHRQGQCTVAAGFGDFEVETPVVVERHHGTPAVALHRCQGRLHAPDLCRTRLARGQRHTFRFEQAARRNQFERAGIAGQRSDAGQCGPAMRDVHTGAHTHLDIALDLERDQRLTHRGSAYLQQACQIAFGREAFAGLVFAAPDQPGDLFGDAAVQPLRFDGLDRHDVGWCSCAVLLPAGWTAQSHAAYTAAHWSSGQTNCAASFTCTPRGVKPQNRAAEEGRWGGVCRASRRW